MERAITEQKVSTSIIWRIYSSQVANENGGGCLLLQTAYCGRWESDPFSLRGAVLSASLIATALMKSLHTWGDDSGQPSQARYWIWLQAGNKGSGCVGVKKNTHCWWLQVSLCRLMLFLLVSVFYGSTKKCAKRDFAQFSSLLPATHKHTTTVGMVCEANSSKCYN